MTIKEAWEIVGGLSKPSKMPGYAYSLPAKECKIGSKLRAIANSVCEKCYAMKGRYMFQNVQDALYRRLKSIKDPRWVGSMSFLINHYGEKGHDFFRWHDSGDVQDVPHLNKIISVCRQTPKVKHWLPTREYNIVSHVLNHMTDDEKVAMEYNLTIRLSGYMVDGKKPSSLANILGVQISSVSSKKSQDHTCPAYRTMINGSVLSEEEFKKLPRKHGLDLGHCGNCRNCWDKKVFDITYKIH